MVNNDAWIHNWVCPHCGKRGFTSRKDAKKLARISGLRGLNAYRCQHAEEEVWHLGHLPPSVVAGRQDRSTVGPAAKRPQKKRRRQ